MENLNFDKILEEVVGRDFIPKLDPLVKKNLQTYIRKNETFKDSLSIDIENYKIQAEQTQFQLENTIKSLNDKINEFNEKTFILESKILNKDNQIVGLEKSIAQRDNDIIELQNKQGSSMNKTYLIMNEKQNLELNVAHKDQKINFLEDDLRHLSEKLMDINSEKNKFQKLYDSETKKMILTEHENYSLKLKVENLAKQIEILEGERFKCVEQYRDNIDKKTKEVNSLTIKFDDMENLWKISQRHNQILKEKYEDIETKNNELLQNNLKLELELTEKVGELRDKFESTEERCKLLSAMNQEYENKYKELKGSLVDVKNVLSQTQKGHEIIQTEFTNLKKSHDDLIKQKDNEIEDLRGRLEDATSITSTSQFKNLIPHSFELSTPALLSQIETFDGQTPSTSSFHLNESDVLSENISYSELYKQYVSYARQLNQLKFENRKLNVSMDCILQEIDRKAPILIKQGHDYRRLIKTVEILSQELDDAKCDLNQSKLDVLNANLDVKRFSALFNCFRDKIRDIATNSNTNTSEEDKYDEFNVSSSSVEDDYAKGNKRMKKVVGDSFASAKLVDSEELKRLLNDPRFEFTSISGNSFSNSNLDKSSAVDHIISHSPFKAHGGGETSNQDLLDVLNKIDGLEREILSCKQINSDQLKVINTLEIQNEQYHKLLSENGLLQLSQNQALNSTEFSDSNRGIVSRLTNELEGIKNIYNQREWDLTKKIHDYNLQNTELKINISKLNYQLECGQEMIKRQELNNSELKLELEKFKKQNVEMYARLGDREMKVDELNKDLVTQKQKVDDLAIQVKRFETECITLNTEIEYLNRNNVSNELDKTKFDAILNNIRNLRESFDLTEKESFGKIASQNVALFDECKEYKIRIETLNLEYNSKTKELEKRLRDIEKINLDLSRKCDDLQNDKSSLSTSLIDTKRQANEKLKKIISTLAKRSLLNLPKGEMIPNIFEEMADSTATDETNDILNNFLNELINMNVGEAGTSFSISPHKDAAPFMNVTRLKDEEIAELKNNVKQQEAHLTHYQGMTESLEYQVKQSQDMIENLEKLLEKQLEANKIIEANMTQKISALENEIKMSESKLQNHQIEMNQSLISKDAEKANLTEKVDLLQLKISELQSNIDRESIQKHALSDELSMTQNQIDQLKTVITNVSNILSLNEAVKLEDIDNTQNQSITSQPPTNNTQLSIEERIARYVQHTQFLEEQNQNLGLRCEGLQKFCDELNAEISKLKNDWDQIMVIDPDKDITIKDIEEILCNPSINTSQSSTQLMDNDKAQNLTKYINYLKNYNSSSREECEILKIECNNYKSIIQTLEAEINSLKSSLLAEKNDQKVYELEDKINALCCALDDKSLEIKLLNGNNQVLHERYMNLVEEHSKITTTDQESNKQIQDLKTDNRSLVSENVALKNTNNRLEERFTESSRKLFNLQSQLLQLTESKHKEEDETKKLKVEIEETCLKLAVYINKDQVNEDKIRDISFELESFRAKIEELKLTNIRIKGIARKYKQLHESSLQGTSGSTALTSSASEAGLGLATTDSVSTSAIDQQSEMGLISDTVNIPSSEDITSKRKSDDVIPEMETYKIKCHDLQKDLEEKNLRLASLKSQYEARFKKLKQQYETSTLHSSGSVESNLGVDASDSALNLLSSSQFTSPLLSSTCSPNNQSSSNNNTLMQQSEQNIMQQSIGMIESSTLDNTQTETPVSFENMNQFPYVIPSFQFRPTSAISNIAFTSTSEMISQTPPKANIRPFLYSVHQSSSTNDNFNPDSSRTISVMSVNPSFIGHFGSGTFMENPMPTEHQGLSSEVTASQNLISYSATGHPTPSVSSVSPHIKPAVCIKPLSYSSHYSQHAITRPMTTNSAIGIAAPTIQFTAEYNNSGLVIVQPFNVSVTTTTSAVAAASSSIDSINNETEENDASLTGNAMDEIDSTSYDNNNSNVHNDGDGIYQLICSVDSTNYSHNPTHLVSSTTPSLNQQNNLTKTQQQYAASPFQSDIISQYHRDENQDKYQQSIQPDILIEEQPGPSNAAHTFYRAPQTSNIFANSSQDTMLKQIVSPIRNDLPPQRANELFTNNQQNMSMMTTICTGNLSSPSTNVAAIGFGFGGGNNNSYSSTHNVSSGSGSVYNKMTPINFYQSGGNASTSLSPFITSGSIMQRPSSLLTSPNHFTGLSFNSPIITSAERSSLGPLLPTPSPASSVTFYSTSNISSTTNIIRMVGGTGIPLPNAAAQRKARFSPITPVLTAEHHETTTLTNIQSHQVMRHPSRSAVNRNINQRGASLHQHHQQLRRGSMNARMLHSRRGISRNNRIPGNPSTTSTSGNNNNINNNNNKDSSNI